MKYTHKLFVPFLCASLAVQPASIAFAEEPAAETSTEFISPVTEETEIEDVLVEESIDETVTEEEIIPEEEIQETSSESEEATSEDIPEEETENPAEETADLQEDPAQVEELIENFMDSLNVTSNFVIYGDTFNENCHIDGNIAVNNLTTDSNIETLKKGGYTAPEEDRPDIDNYSIVYNGNNLKYGTVDHGAVIVSGGNLSAQNLNGGSKVVDITDQLNKADTAEKQIAIIADTVANAQTGISDQQKQIVKDRVIQEADIDGNLANIATQAAALNKQLAKDRDIDGVNAVNAAIQVMENDALNSDSIITINVTPEELNDSRGDQLTGRLSTLLQLNKSKNVGAKIILNVVNKTNDTALTITQPLNGNGAYDVYTDYVIWNFGDFGGTVTYTQTTEGIIVAPNATVNVVVMDGRVIADTINQGRGQEIHQPNNSKKDIPEEPKPEEPKPEEPKPEEPTPEEPKPEEPDDSNLQDDPTDDPNAPDDAHLNDEGDEDEETTDVNYDEDEENEYDEDEDVSNSGDEDDNEKSIAKGKAKGDSKDSAVTTSSAKTGDDHNIFGMLSVFVFGLLALSSQFLPALFRRKK